ncbi:MULTISPECIES: DinB family protein [unclassified Bacillus (in: firmicutes)]|uniref:DinB family protein n=1 Tax=unclassified Bacillus (in: firmicutes) TaxID=185979 RepID=UPI0008F233FD|nr:MULTISPECIES: DinB family protein [unclassified Bacillus (in: firmicutes)]SFA70391.1 DinB superfamily protein [Bacillus sp. UNCCL13]SFQ60099.1 DinB superfamily protein [Bacillus sp. cl95]
MGAKSVLNEQMNALHKNHWFVSLTNAIEGLTPEQASWKQGDFNSILEIVNHLIFYNERYLNRFKKIPVSPKNISSIKETFTDHQNWNEAAEHIQEIMAEWRDLIKGSEESCLNNEENWNIILANFTVHVAYHVGQIVLLRKLQGSWNEAYGVSK